MKEMNENYEESKSLVIEGRNAVLEALRSGKPMDKLYVLDGCQDGPIRTIVREAKKHDVILQFVTKERLNQLSETGKHQGVIAHAAAYEYAQVEDMLELANELELAYSKKTPHKNLDMKNKALQDYVTLAYRLKYLKGATSHAEWTRRSKEIGCMLGGYKKWLYDDTPSTAKSSGKQQTSSSKKSYQCRSR